MNIRQELAVGQYGARLLRPGHIVDVLQARALRRQSGIDLAVQLGALTRRRFQEARTEGARPTIIPAKNEATDLPATLVALARTGNALPLVVDNCSTDETAAVAAQMGAIVIDQPAGKKMAASKAGMQFALHELGAREALFIDADTLVLPQYPQAMGRRLAEIDNGRGAGVFGSSYRMFGASRVADVVTTATNFRDNARREWSDTDPVPRGHTYALRFDADGAIEANLMALPDDLSVCAAEAGVADDVAIFRAVVAAGAVVAGSVDPDSLVITANRIDSFGQLWAMHKGATWEDVTSASYAQQYGGPPSA
jgi:glycosyltransferase involved in cell wall biosynthesis